MDLGAKVRVQLFQTIFYWNKRRSSYFPPEPKGWNCYCCFFLSGDDLWTRYNVCPIQCNFTYQSGKQPVLNIIPPSSEQSVEGAESTLASLARQSLPFFFIILLWFSRLARNSYFLVLSQLKVSRLIMERYERLKTPSTESLLAG